MKMSTLSARLKKLQGNSAFKIALCYFLFSFLWILLSDRAISLIATNSRQITNLQTFKGWLFITGTTLLIFFLVVREIRKKNRLIILLNESNKWYNLLIKHVPNVDVLMIDPQKQFIIAQGNILLKLGWRPPKEVQDKFLKEKDIDKDLFQLLLRDFNEVMDGKSTNSEFEKNDFSLEISGVPVHSDQGELLAALFVIIDNTADKKNLFEISKQRNEYEQLYKKYENISNELKELNREIINSYHRVAESEEKYRMFFENINDGASILELQHDEQKVIFIEVNEKLAFQLDYRPEELKGINAMKIIEDTHEQFLTRLNEVMIKKKLRFETIYLSKGKKRIPFEVSIYLLQSDERNFFFTIARNITEQKKYIHELEIAKEQAESADRLKTAFLANMSHEIRTPLNGILGFSEILADESLPSEKRTKYNQIIRNSGERLLNLLRDILDLSKIESGQFTINTWVFSKNDLCLEIEKFLKQTIIQSRKNIKYSFIRETKEADECTGDKEVLLRIASLLIDNSVKFTPDGLITVSFMEEKAHHFTLICDDSGIGMDQEDIPHIFERFRKLDEGDESEFSGLGIGLSIVKGMLDLLNGSIHITSQKGKGTRVTVSFVLPSLNEEKKVFLKKEEKT